MDFCRKELRRRKVMRVAEAIGFPTVLVLSWMFEITRGGLERTAPADEEAPAIFRHADPEPIDPGERALLLPELRRRFPQIPPA